MLFSFLYRQDLSLCSLFHLRCLVTCVGPPVGPVSGLRGRDLVACNTAWWPSEALEMTAPAPPCLQPGDIIFTDPDGAGGHGLAARAVPHGACPFQAALQGPCPFRVHILSFLSPQPPATATVWVCTCCATERGTARVLGRGDPVASAQRGAFPQSSWKSFVYRQRPSLQSL